MHPTTYTAKAYSATSERSSLASTKIQRRDPTDRDVQIEILFCGICHSDLHSVRNEWSEFMKDRSRHLFISLICIFAIVQLLNAQEPKAAKPKQFIYVLRPVPRLHADSAWTKEDNAALERHFVRFQQAAKSGQLILAGRTSEPGDKTFGIAIFEAPDEGAARKFMRRPETTH